MAGIPEPVGGEGEVQFLFSSLLGMERVTSKYMRTGYRNGDAKLVPTPPHCYACTQKV